MRATFPSVGVQIIFLGKTSQIAAGTKFTGLKIFFYVFFFFLTEGKVI